MGYRYHKSVCEHTPRVKEFQDTVILLLVRVVTYLLVTRNDKHRSYNELLLNTRISFTSNQAYYRVYQSLTNSLYGYMIH